MYHEKKLAESSELAEGGGGSKEEKGERDLDDVGRLPEKYYFLLCQSGALTTTLSL